MKRFLALILFFFMTMPALYSQVKVGEDMSSCVPKDIVAGDNILKFNVSSNNFIANAMTNSIAKAAVSATAAIKISVVGDFSTQGYFKHFTSNVEFLSADLSSIISFKDCGGAISDFTTSTKQKLLFLECSETAGVDSKQLVSDYIINATLPNSKLDGSVSINIFGGSSILTGNVTGVLKK
jgi:hypothetical protein